MNQSLPDPDWETDLLPAGNFMMTVMIIELPHAPRNGQGVHTLFIEFLEAF